MDLYTSRVRGGTLAEHGPKCLSTAWSVAGRGCLFFAVCGRGRRAPLHTTRFFSCCLKCPQGPAFVLAFPPSGYFNLYFNDDRGS